MSDFSPTADVGMSHNAPSVHECCLQVAVLHSNKLSEHFCHGAFQFPGRYSMSIQMIKTTHLLLQPAPPALLLLLCCCNT
jgi:hypothetical protein